MISQCRFSIWKELKTMLYLVSYIIANSFSFVLTGDVLADLSVFCANSKRKRLPVLFKFSNAA